MSFEILRNIALTLSNTQKEQVDTLTEDTPFLDIVPFTAATHDWWHNVAVLDTTDSMDLVDVDAPLPAITSRKKLEKFDLVGFGGSLTVPEELAKKYGSADKYFEDHLKPVIKSSGMKMEKRIAYYSLRQYAIDNRSKGKNVYDAGGTGNNNYSIIAIRFEEGVCQGLYNANGFGEGGIFDLKPLNNGALYEINSDRVLGYGVRLRSGFGYMTIGTRNVGAIVNIDLTRDTDKAKPKAGPTAMMIDDMLADIRSTSTGRTVMVMAAKVKGEIVRGNKDTVIQMRPKDKIIDRDLESWGGVPIVVSYNMEEGTEKKVSLS